MATSPLRLLDTPAPRALLDYRPMGLSMEETAALDAPGGNSFTNAFRGSLIGTEANAAAAEESSLRAAGDPASIYQANNLRRKSLEAQRRAQAYAPAASSYEDVMEQGIGSVPGYVAGQLGQMAGSALDPMAAGVGIGLAGSALSALPWAPAKIAGAGLRYLAAPGVAYKMNADQLTGEAYNTVAEDPVAMQRSAQDINDEVRGHGYRAAVLDTAGQLLPMGQLARGLPKMISRIPSSAKFAGGAAIEGLTETGQQISQHFAHEALNPERDTTHDLSENINSGLGGFFGGGGMSAIGNMGEAAWSRLAEPGDGKNGDVIPLTKALRDAGSDLAPEQQASRLSLLNGAAILKTDTEKRADPDYEPIMKQLGEQRRTALLEELAKDKSATAKTLAAELSAIDLTDPINVFDPTFDAAAELVIPKAGLMSEKDITAMGKGRVKKSQQVAGTEIEKHVYPTGPNQSRFSKLSGRLDEVGTPGVDSTIDPKELVRSDTEMLPGPLKPLVADPITTGKRKVTKGGVEVKTAASADSDLEAPVADASTHSERAAFNTSLLWNQFKAPDTKSKIPVNRGSRDTMDMIGDELAAAASQGVRESPTPGEHRRAETIGRALASMLGPKAITALEAIAERNGVKLKASEDATVDIGKGETAVVSPFVESPVFQVAYDTAVRFSDGTTTHETEAVRRGDRAKELVGMVPTHIATTLLNEGIDLHNPKVSHRLLNVIEDLVNGDERQRMQLNNKFTKTVVDKLVDRMGHGAQIEARHVPIKSVSGKTAATDSDTDGTTEGGAELETSKFEERQLVKNLDKSPPETLVFHHKRGVGPVTTLKDAFKELETGSLPALIREGEMNTVPDNKGGKPVSSITRLLRNAVKTVRGRDGTWGPEPTDGGGYEWRSIYGPEKGLTLKKEKHSRNHVFRAATALEVMNSSNLPDSKREQLMFRYIDQEGGPDQTDLKNMLGVVRSLAAYDRQYSAATIKRDKIGPNGGKLSMAEADEQAHPGKAMNTIDKLQSLAATPEDAALVLSTFHMNTASRNTTLMGVVRRAKVEAMKQLAQTEGFKDFVDANKNEDSTPEFKDLVNHFFSKRHMVVAEHKSDGDYLKIDRAEFAKMTAKGEDLIDLAQKEGLKFSPGGFRRAEQIRAEHRMGLLRWYHSSASPKRRTSATFSDKSGSVAIQAKELVAWVRQQRNDHTASVGDKKDDVRGENYGDTRKDEDFLRDLTQGIIGLIDQGFVSGMPYIINGKVFDKTNPNNEVRGWTGEDGKFEFYTNEDGTPDMGKVNPKDLAGEEEWFSEDGIPPSLKLAGRSYKQMVTARKAGYEQAQADKKAFEDSEGLSNKAKREKAAQDKHDAEVAGISYNERGELLDEDEMTSAAEADARAEDIDNTDMQSQEQQDEAEAEVEGASQFVDERAHIEAMTKNLKAAANWPVKPLNRNGAFDHEGQVVADGLQAEYTNANGIGAHTNVIQRIMSYARSIDRPTSVPKDTMNTADSSVEIKEDMGLGGHHYVGPLAMLLTPRFMATANKSDEVLFMQLRGFVAKKMLEMMEPDPFTGKPELGGRNLGTLVDALSGRTDRAKQTELDKKVPTDPEQAAKWEASKAERQKWSSQEVSSKQRDKFLKGLIVNVTGKPNVRKRVAFTGATYESLIKRYEQSATFINNERVAKGEARLEKLQAEILKATQNSPEWHALVKQKNKLIRALKGAQEGVSLGHKNTVADGDKTETVSVAGTPTRFAAVKRKAPELTGPTQPAGVQLAANQKRQIEENKGGLGRSTATGPDGRIAASQAEVDADTEQVNLGSEKLSAALGAKVEQLRAKPAVAKSEAKVGLLASPPTAPAAHQAKETAKLLGADLVLAPISTQGYAGSLGRAAQVEGKLLTKITSDVAGKTVLVSVPGKGRGFTAMPALIARVTKALDNGASVRTDNQENAERAWNVDGEGALRAALIAGGYVETSGKDFSSWVMGEVAQVAQPAQPKVVQPVRTNAPTFPMNYRDGQIVHSTALRMRPEFAGKDTMDLILSGDRTATTGSWGRFNGAKKGDVVMAKGNGKEALIRFTSDPYPVVKGDNEAWSRLEGWAPAVMNEYLGQYQMTYELVNKPKAAESTDLVAQGRALLAESARTHSDEAATTKHSDQVVEAKTSAPFVADPKFHEIIKVRAWLQKVLGPDVNVLIEKAFPDMKGWNADWSAIKGLIRIATDGPIGITTLAHHEAVHAFFTKILAANPEAKELMERTFSTPAMKQRLLATFTNVKHDGSDASKLKIANLIKAIENDPEERAAYAFQLWKMDMLTVDKKPQGFFEKLQRLMRVVFGAVRDSEKALAIMESFDAGKLVEPSAAGMAITKIMQTDQWRKNFLKKIDKFAQAAYTEVMANELVGLNMGIKVGREIALMWHTNPARADNADQPGVLNRQREATDQYINRLSLALAELNGVNAKDDLKALGVALNEHSEPAPHLAPAYKALQSLMRKYYEYAKDAGVDIGERLGTAGDKDYYPRVMDLGYLIDHKDEFVAMLTGKYARVLKAGKHSLISDEMPEPTEIDVANKLFDNFVNREGVTDPALAVSREDGILNPLFWSGEARSLHWINDEDMAPFLSTDVIATMTQYLRQGVRAAEYTRTFGKGGEKLSAMMARKGEKHAVEGAGGKYRMEEYAEDGDVLVQLKEKAIKDEIPEAEREAWVERRYEDLQRMNGAMEGSLGKDVSSLNRKIQGGLMTYQTLRLLPFMLFSSMLDPVGIRSAGGSSEDMFNAYKRGFTAVWHNWKDMLLGNPANARDADRDEMAALEAGVVNNLVHLEEMGVVASSEYSAGVTREINHTFFKAVGITHWDRAMRISAASAARKSIASMIRGDSKEHSARWLKEVGLKPGQGTINAEGELIATRKELAAFKGITLEEAAAELVPIHHALNRWVMRAIVSPNAAVRPTRASDPHFAMFYQFKSFTYAFQETVMRYAAHEAANGNLDAGAHLLKGIPVMIAADMAKAMVMGGGSLPKYMAGWTMADWVTHGINRSLGTTVNMGVDALSNPMGLFGPTVDQAGDILAAPFQGDTIKTVADAVPGLRYVRSGVVDSASRLMD